MAKDNYNDKYIDGMNIVNNVFHTWHIKVHELFMWWMSTII